MNKQIFLITSWIGVIVALVFDSLGSKQTTQSLIGISSTTLSCIYLLVLLIARFKYGYILPKSTQSAIVFLLAPISLLVGLSLSVWEYITPDNYVYSLTRLNPEKLVELGHFSIGVFLLSASLHWYASYGRLLVWILPLWFLVVYYWTFILPFDAAVHFTQEDGPVESIQNTLLLFAIALCGWEIKKSTSPQHKLRRKLFFIVLLILGFVFMEEISWGQRILGTQTPQKLIEINVQNETNIHNIGIMNQLQWVGYIAISGVGVIWPLSEKIRGHKTEVSTLSPPLITSWYMLLPLIFYVYTIQGPHVIHGEVVEVLFYAGIVSWIGKQLSVKDSIGKNVWNTGS